MINRSWVRFPRPAITLPLSTPQWWVPGTENTGGGKYIIWESRLQYVHSDQTINKYLYFLPLLPCAACSKWWYMLLWSLFMADTSIIIFSQQQATFRYNSRMEACLELWMTSWRIHDFWNIYQQCYIRLNVKYSRRVCISIAGGPFRLLPAVIVV